ncbi:MAG: Asp23/Gls24 family envelope stress response protein [Oscillospiraceae bacterium]
MAENYIARQDERGSINISEDVIAVMVGAAIAEVEGVAGLSNTIGSEIADFIGRKSVTKGVKVQFVEDKIVVDVIVMVRFGTKITEVGEKVQEAVASAVESMTGLDAIVNVHISGISYEK